MLIFSTKSKKPRPLSFVNDQLNPFEISRRIAVIYFIVGALWILFSDKLVAMFVNDKDTITLISLLKGWLYIIVTAAMLFTIIFNYMKRIQNAEEKLIDNYEELEKAHTEIALLNHELEQRVEDRTKELNSAIKEIEAFNYSVSHDLRAPLRSIDGFGQILQDTYADKLDGQGQHYLERIISAAKRMGILIDELLNLSRLGRSELKYEQVNLSSIAKNVFYQLKEVDTIREVTFIAPDNVIAYCDKQLIQTVFENLLGNAWKFSSKHISGKIQFGVIKEDDRTIYYIKDDGAGFNSNYSDKLFKPFQRLHRVDEFEGNGIGLANVYRIIRKHGGEIWAESAVEQGAAFYFTLFSQGKVD